MLSCIITGGLFAQDRTKMRPADRLIIGLFTDVWSDLPGDVKTKGFNRGVSIDYLQDFPMGTSNFAVAVGLGFQSHNLYTNGIYTRTLEGFNFFETIPSSVDYRTNKISLNYLTLPLELRYRSRDLPKTFRVNAGLKAGYLIDAHTKFVGKWDGKNMTKYKEGKLGNIEKVMLGVNTRIGYGRFNLNGYFPIQGIFKAEADKDASFMSIGLSMIMF